MERMHQLADEVREVFEERGFRIGQAVQLDPAFNTTRRPQSSLGRALFIEAIQVAASHIGLGYRTVRGGACDVSDIVGSADRRFRVRKAGINPHTGDYVIMAGSESILTVSDAEADSLFTVERWVLGYTVDDDGLIADIFAARVIGMTEESVPCLRLGPVTLLGADGFGTPPSGGGFQPAQENDLGDDDLDQGDSNDAGESTAS
ncbi:hypothetical protein CKJ65_18680 [Mycobacterium intracellulare]|uniref:hypothetical protein n=1 Tax=Mycobacterium intracellulare TaxID=1767 RepID=UPI000BB009EA|nr:hypothetical protein [Mycobacterium intracellulare]PBA30411.1 hypothetical protein CKJ65_18680 [Mycobacterium intracellulare]